MATLTLSTPTIGQPNSTEDQKLHDDIAAIGTWSTQLDKTNLATPSGIVKIAGTLADLSVATGTSSFQPAGGNHSVPFNFNHTLGIIPKGWLLTPTSALDGSVWAAQFGRTQAPTNTLIYVTAYPYWWNGSSWQQTFNGTTYSFSWIVWG